MQKKKDLSENKNEKQPTGKAYRAVVNLLYGITKLLWPYKIYGSRELPEGGCMVCPNHISFVDILLVSSAFESRTLRYMAKKEFFKFKPFASFFYAVGAYPVDRKGGDVGAIKTAIKIVESGEAAVIFPQGHRNPGKDPKETKVHGGAMLIARRAGVPIVPVYIKTKNRRILPFRKIEIYIGPAITPDELADYGENNNEAMKALFDRACDMEKNGKWM